jgi:RNA polymerase sigma factor (sigma-70 family)
MATAQLDTLLRHIENLAAGSRVREATDRQLLDDFVDRGNEAAFTALVSRHGPMVLRVCRRVLFHEQDAEDAFQATFLVLVDRAGSIRKRDTVADWLYGVAFRTAMKAKRSAARRRNHEARRRADAPQNTAGPTWDDVQAVLDEEIQRLPARFREAFVLCVLEGKGGREVAAELACSEGTVKSRLNRARQQLRKRLTRRGIQLAALLAALSVGESGSRAAVPALLARATIRLGLLAAAGKSTGGVIPPHVAALAAGVTRAISVTKFKIAVVTLLSVGLLAGFAGVIARGGFAAPGKNGTPAPTKRPAVEKAKGAQQQAPADKQSIAVRGRVFRPDGKPLAGAKLYQTFWMDFFNGNPGPAPKLRGTSGPDGRFHFTVSREELAKNPKAVLQVVAVADGFGPDWVRVEKAGARPLNLRLVKDDMPIRGRILNLEGRPISGAAIRPLGLMTTANEDLTPWLQAIKDHKRFQHRDILTKQLFGFAGGIPGLPPVVKTGADGRFRLTGIGRERVVTVRIGGPKVRNEWAMILTRSVPKFQIFDSPASVTKFAAYGATFDHVTAPAKPLIGTVKDKDTGKPLAGVKIQVEGSFLHVMTNREGTYRIESLPGDYAGQNDFGTPILAIPPAGQPYLVGFKEVKPGPGLEATTVNYQLKRGVWAQGKVTDQATGKPVQAYIQYQPTADNPHRKDAADFTRFPTIAAELYSTRSDGTFRLPALPGPGVITARGPYGHYLRDGTVQINPTQGGKAVECTITLQPGRTLTGAILGPDGKPLTGVRVFNMKPLHFWTPQPLKTASFRLTAVDPRGRRTLVFQHAEKHLVKALELQGNTPSPITVQLERAATITGRLVDEEGQPRPRVNLQIHFVRKDNDYVAEHFPAIITTDRKGRFRVDGLAPGINYQINLAGKRVTQTIGAVANRLYVKPGETKDLGDVKGRLFPH